jgi:D-cysteine desulfhydrase
VKRPSPAEPLAALGERVWVKRDDQVSDVYGGNKVRRWEWLLAEARDRGKRAVLTVGGLGSTQVTSLIAHGTRAGFDVYGVLFDQPETAFVHEALALDAGAGGHLVYGGRYGRTAYVTLREILRRKDAMIIAPGASGPVANMAYVDAMLELGLQVERGEAPRPDRIVVACGSGGTAVGLAVGAAILGWPTRVVAARITDRFVSNTVTLGALARLTRRLLRQEGFRGKVWPVHLEMEHRFAGPGYGMTTPEAERGAARFEELFGVPGEITYSGKAMAALEAAVREHPADVVLLWNTLSTTGRTPPPIRAESLPPELARFASIGAQPLRAWADSRA